MTRLLITTVRRHTPYSEPSGFIYTVDWENQDVVLRSLMAEPAYRESDKNPRGGIRGSRGIAIREDQIAIANASMIFRYDPQWNLLGTITHPSCNAIHDILFHEDTLWVASARNDLLFQFDFSGNILRHYYLRDPSPVRTELGWKSPILLQPDQIRQGVLDFRNPLTHEEEVYDHAHVNSICFLPNGDMLVSLGLVLGVRFATLLRLKNRLLRWGIWPTLLEVNRKIRSLLGLKKHIHSDLVVQPAKGLSAIVCIATNGEQSLSLVLQGMTVPSHSLLSLNDGTVLYLNTTEGKVIHFEPYSRKILSSTQVTDGFLRGITQLPDGTFLMGSKQELLAFDLLDRRVVKKMLITDDAYESIYDIKILLPHYENPPTSFEEHFEKLAGCKAETLIRGDLGSSRKEIGTAYDLA